MAVNKHWIASALAGAALTLPFAALELANRPAAGYAFPVPLFGALWLLAGTFALLLAPLFRAGVRPGAARIALLAIIAALWAAILIDQLPCFLGVPFCD